MFDLRILRRLPPKEVHGFFNFQLEASVIEAESRILKQSSEQREGQFSEPLRCLKMLECFWGEMFTDGSARVLTGAGIQNIRCAAHDALAGILMHWHGTCWEARFKPARKCSFSGWIYMVNFNVWSRDPGNEVTSTGRHFARRVDSGWGLIIR